MSLTYANLPLAQNPSVLNGYSRDSVSPAPILEYLSLSGKENKWKRTSVANTLFNGSTPRLSRLELKYCDISWKSPLFRGLRHLIIHTLSANARPSLSVWLNALDEMSQLRTLVLHSASPITPSFPFDIERTVTLPSLIYVNISASPEDCGLALAHLVLPALTSLCVTAFSSLRDGGDVQRMLPYVAQHAYGPQDTWPLRSVLIHGHSNRVNILAWPVPDIDVEVHDPPALLATTLSPRVTLYIKSNVWYEPEIDILDAAMAALPLDGLVILTAEHFNLMLDTGDPRMNHFWLRSAPRWPLLRRVRLGTYTERGFIKMLLEEIGGGESPLLPSLTELVVAYAPVDDRWTHRLCDALMRRVEQGVSLEVLDLRMGFLRFPAAVPLLSEIVVEVLGPMMETRDPWDAVGPGPGEYERISNMWDPIIRGFEYDNSGAEDDSDADGITSARLVNTVSTRACRSKVWELIAILEAGPKPLHGLGIANYSGKHAPSAITRLQQFPELPSVKLVPQLRELTASEPEA
ncbi:hypothetical protein EDB92DRAFT_1815257 [Lactarius akahatsu]|uniref:F-box domain-containing protein n=1 Tax=Lactarius akahatsu TaxID=416441 RepID=A0AAD4QEQ3_9AGAM|nr:hypothetical protein EDB92DRAFT_1815257 [Lactarius akahatsu]